MPSRLRYPLFVTLLLAAYFFMAVSAARTKGPTFDEVVHITAGYSAWINHDQRFDPGNGDFVKRWATIPLLFTRPMFPPLTTESWRNAEFFLVGRDFMFNSGNDPDAILRQTRVMVTLLGVMLGLLVFGCARSLFGNAGGLIALTLFAFSPHMLAHGALVSTDLALTFSLFASTWLAWRLLHRVTWTNLIGSLLAFSLLVISKMSAVLIVPIAAVLIVVRALNPEPWRWELAAATALATRGRQLLAVVVLVAAHALAGWLAIWTVFDFKFVARAEPADTSLALMRSPDAKVDGVVSKLSDFCHQHRLLPEGYLKGMEELVGISKRRPSFMNGHWKAGGRTSFFPYAFWVKTSPALLALLLLGASGWAWSLRNREARSATAAPTSRSARRRLYDATPLFVLFVIYVAVALRQGVNIGHRHILAIYPVLYVLAGSVSLLPWARRPVGGLVVAALLGGFVVDSLHVRPHYLAYFSPLVGGPAHGYQHLADSSLDWGQDLPELKRWLAQHHPDDRGPVFLSYFGTGIPEHYGITSKRLPGFPEWRELRVFALTPGCYAISATLFQQLYTMTFGPWNRVYEAEYQATIQQLGLTEENTADSSRLGEALQAHPDAFWQEQYSRYEKLRFARLCGWLRATGRSPDATAGYSILIWNLDPAALHDALWEAPRELHERPASDEPEGI